MRKKFYVTTAIDYINDVIHIGHIYQKVIADVFARYHRIVGNRVFFLTGTDEHGSKAEIAATAAGLAKNVKEFVDKIARKDIEEQKSIGVSFDRFIRTTDPDHIKFVKIFWKKTARAGDIYSGEYEGIYCGGCEAYLSKSEIEEGRCPFHPEQKPQIVKEKNYFFRLSKYSSFLKKHIQQNPNFIWPESRKNEMLSFIKEGLQDIPISRSKIRWGIPVPGDPKQTVYVWFDALINYLSGAPTSFWPADVHVLGKDNTRFHTLLWPAMLRSAGYPLPKTVLVNGFLTLNGQKISKSLGNIIRASELVQKFGADPVRYYLLASKPIDTDGDVSEGKIAEAYRADLANGLGNLVSRVAKLAEKIDLEVPQKKSFDFSPEVEESIERFRLDEALSFVWKRISEVNRKINQEKPWELTGKKLTNFLSWAINEIRQIAFDLQPFMPTSAEKILNQFKGPKIKAKKPLFPRL
ncbi:MAG TPA: methionine--tRNA ligase [Clostridia bacterium]|nr:methionine--tRNA ligase [Clostridia bacterium]